MKGLEQRRIQHRIGEKINRVQALVDWSHEGQQPHSTLHMDGGLGSCTIRRYIIMCVPWGETRILFHHWTIASWLFFLCSCIPLLPWRSPITETCSRARSWPDLDHRMALAKKKNGFFHVKKAMPGSLSPRTSPPTHQLIGFQMPFSPAFSVQSVEPCVPSPIHLWCSKMIARSLNYYYLEQEAKERKVSYSMTKVLSTSQ